MNGVSQLPPLLLTQWYPHIIAVAVAYFSADISVNYARQYMISSASPTSGRARTYLPKSSSRSSYGSIARRNAFNADGVIPNPISAELDGGADGGVELPPVRSQLPLELIGTIVSSNPDRSVATIQHRGRNKVVPYQIGEEIDGMAEIEEISRRQVIFRNLNNSRREFIELKVVSKIAFGGSAGPATDANAEVKSVGDNKFELERSVINKYTSDLPSLLQQARAVPSHDPVTGEINGYKVLDIKEGSIFEKLGILPLDTIKTVNGETVDSPKKAMGMYQALRNEARISIGVERNGRTVSLEFNIK